jgi:hypothetical protein
MPNTPSSPQLPDSPAEPEPNYTSMVHRETDGSDPLVQEPKGKP